MAKKAKRSDREHLAELQGWYLGSLLPKLAGAASTGAVAPAAAEELDRQLRDLLDLSRAGAERAA